MCVCEGERIRRGRVEDGGRRWILGGIEDGGRGVMGGRGEMGEGEMGEKAEQELGGGGGGGTKLIH